LEYLWKNRKIEVESVIAKAEQFLRDRDFIIRREKGENSVKLTGVRRREKYDVRLVEIAISWSLEDLSVKFDVGDHMKPILRLSPFISFWGGGPIILKELRAAEQYDKVEDEFWREIERIIPGSSGP
jgi:hypothetical protein